jgi:YVTN family beta-propeller protein
VGLDEHTAYVTNEDSDDVTVVDLDNRRIVTSISVGYGPTEIVLQPRVPQKRP